jgi:DNA processing protein
LIKDGAKLTEDVEDILSEFEYLLPRESQKAEADGPQARGTEAAVRLSDLEAKVMAAIGDEEAGIDEIIRSSGLTSACVNATLLGLEMKRLVKQFPGKLYARNAAIAS